MNYQGSERDELRARFTAWLEKVVSRARIDYMRRLGRYAQGLSWEELEDQNRHEELSHTDRYDLDGSFSFEDDKLRAAFERLSPAQRDILVMLYVKELEPKEAASELGCQIADVYNQKSRAIRKLRSFLERGGGER